MFPRFLPGAAVPRAVLLLALSVPSLGAANAGAAEKAMTAPSVAVGDPAPLSATQQADLAAKELRLHEPAIVPLAGGSLFSPWGGKPAPLATILPSPSWDPELLRAAKQAALLEALMAARTSRPAVVPADAADAVVKPAPEAAGRGEVGAP